MIFSSMIFFFMIFYFIDIFFHDIFFHDIFFHDIFFHYVDSIWYDRRIEFWHFPEYSLNNIHFIHWNIFVLFYSIIHSQDDDEDCSDFNDTDDDETNTKSSRYLLNLKYQYLSMIHGHFHLWHMNIILIIANLFIPMLQNLICRHFISTIFSPLFSPHF